MDNRNINSSEQREYLNFWKNAFLLNTAIPAIVDEFDPETQRVSATPAIKAKYTTPELEVQYIDYPKITNIPLAMIKCPGLKITCPVKQGQNCTLIFSQRSIDNFLIDGQIRAPFEGENPALCSIRCMDMTDAMCFPGIITNPEAISEYNNNAIEIRNDEGTTKITVSQNDLQFTQGNATIKLSDDNITMSADKITLNGTEWDTHVHSGVTSGDSNTGVIV